MDSDLTHLYSLSGEQAATTAISSLAYFPVSLYLGTYTVSLLGSEDAFKPNLVISTFNVAAMIGSNITGKKEKSLNLVFEKSLAYTISTCRSRLHFRL